MKNTSILNGLPLSSYFKRPSLILCKLGIHNYQKVMVRERKYRVEIEGGQSSFIFNPNNQTDEVEKTEDIYILKYCCSRCLKKSRR